MSSAHSNLAAPTKPELPLDVSDRIIEKADDQDFTAEPHSADLGHRMAVLSGTTAFGYYLSVLLHIVAYITAAVIFLFFGPDLFNDDVSFVIRASLDDMTVQDENARLEMVPDLSMGTTDGQSSIDRISSNLKAVENGLIDTAAADMLPSMLSKKDDTDDTGGASFLFKLPESGLAVTKGSFTAWTEPEVPEVGRPYLIIIEVRLPKTVKGYRINDLSGTIRGTDGYGQSIPFDANQKSSSFYTDENGKHRIQTGSESIKVRANKIQLGIQVPGARKLVRDTIQIRSRRLREKQQLELVFGVR
ncbi:MAG: hypothetical protein P8J37_14525 [Fuerstiella sp.]|nr:hypothetical protein [Fuerstiella sp.]